MKRSLSSDSDDSCNELSQKINKVHLSPQRDHADEEEDDDASDYDPEKENEVVSVSKPLLGQGKRKSLGLKRSVLSGSLISLTGGSLPSYKPLRFKSDPSTLKKAFKIPTFLNGKPALAGGMKSGINLGMRRSSLIPKGPLHNPDDEDAIVLYHPKVTLTQAQHFQMSLLKKDKDQPVPEVHVVIDPILAKVLRPHQIEGVFVSI